MNTKSKLVMVIKNVVENQTVDYSQLLPGFCKNNKVEFKYKKIANGFTIIATYFDGYSKLPVYKEEIINGKKKSLIYDYREQHGPHFCDNHSTNGKIYNALRYLFPDAADKVINLKNFGKDYHNATKNVYKEEKYKNINKHGNRYGTNRIKTTDVDMVEVMKGLMDFYKDHPEVLKGLGINIDNSEKNDEVLKNVG